MYYYGKRIHKVREIASLTKMVTAMTAIDFLSKHGWEPHEICY
jgi:D-alanyl-D-alanine carboxypeptidase